ncbi:hypothetical protein LTR36_002785 [Oleoguttula mirabilis]|uniref:Uncharacterized protein n=1 Tax=Oleoguttula mirabilis TaxID=1507867 RepID=A0AAV9JJN1_9PEZI|nr:hypothetical protein LTR36_002785 [Oleoguttula mirabilis]
MASPTKPSPTANTKPNRLPAPTLFVGPPSRNASQLSVSRQGNDGNLKSGPHPLNRQKSALAKPYNTDAGAAGDANGIPALKKQSEKSVDAKWREMQSTLNEVELTAQSSTHVFGESHAKALDDLRNAQVELARAWGRGNEDKASQAATNSMQGQDINRFQGAEDIASDRFGQQRRRGDTDASASTTLSDESTTTTGTARTGRSQLEDETAQDIKLASERRAANEAYFKKVDEGVKDVVAKLEVVAEAMRGVEGESRSLWSGSTRSSDSTERDEPGSASQRPARAVAVDG